MIRLFTGLSLPDDIADELTLLRGGLPGARWMDRADFHITLQFIGNVEENVADELHEAFLRLRKPPVEVILDRLDVFGGRKPRSIAVVARATPGLVDLQAAHERICKRNGVDIELRKYIPHVTLARLRSISSDKLADYTASRGYFRPRTFLAGSFFLFSSARSGGGGPYVAEAEYQMQE